MEVSLAVRRDPGVELQRDGERVRCLRRLVPAVQQLSRAGDRYAILDIAQQTARALIGAGAATIAIGAGDGSTYVETQGALPLWQAKRLPAERDIRDWVIANRRPLAIAITDIAEDPRIPADAANGLVRGAVMVPIGGSQPIGALGTYWAEPYQICLRDLSLLQILTDCAREALDAIQASREGFVLPQARRLLTGRKATASMPLQDPLTGLYNVHGFYQLGERVRQAARRMGVRTFVLFIRTDPDAALAEEQVRQLAGFLRATLRSSDIVARLVGGFGVFGIEGRAGQAAIERRLARNILPFGASLALGFQHLPTDGVCSVEAVLKRAAESARSISAPETAG